MKVCIFGGTFDPPHIGHLIIAEAIKESENIDRMIFVPAFLPPHKEATEFSSVEDRLKMLKLSLIETDNFELSNIEIKRGGVSYSIETIREIKEEFELTREEIYFLIGSDSLIEFHNWKNPEKILRESQVIVALRPGFRPSKISQEYLSKIWFSNVLQVEISSSQIRQRVHSGLSIKYLVLDSVLEYIKEKELYLQ